MCTYFLLKKYDYSFRRLIVNSRENLLKTLTEFYFWSVIIPWNVIIPWEVTKSLRLYIPKIVLAENYCVRRWSTLTLKWKFKCRSFLKELIEILTKHLTYKVCVFRLRRFLLDWKKSERNFSPGISVMYIFVRFINAYVAHCVQRSKSFLKNCVGISVLLQMSLISCLCRRGMGCCSYSFGIGII